MTLTTETHQPLSPGITRPLIVASWTYAAGYLPLLATRLGGPIPPWVMPLVGITAGLIGMRLARMEWTERLFEPSLSELASILSCVTGAAMAAWFWYAAMATPLRAAMWLVFGALPLGAWYWFLYRSAERQMNALRNRARMGGVDLPATDPQWTAILEAAGFPGVHVQSAETQAGVTLTVRPNPERPATSADMSDRIKLIATRTAFARPDIEIREDDVRIEPAPVLPCVLVHISWKRPLRESLPYIPSTHARDINDPAPLGVDEVGSVVSVRLAAQNGTTVAATDGGKTVEANVEIGRITECSNALVWVGATDKLLPFVYPWLLPWLTGQTDRPIIDWVAGLRSTDVLDMLADVYAVVRMRNARNTRKSKHIATRESPAIVVYIEESTDLMRRREKVHTFDGLTWTASALLERICAADRSAGVSVRFMSQSALVDALGDFGSDIMRNVNLRICGRTNSAYDGQATIPGLRGNVDTTRLRDNTMLMQPHNEDPRVFPWKSFYLEDDHMIGPVVTANTRWRPDGIESEVAMRLRAYRYRWDDGRLPDIVAECEAEGFSWPGTSGPGALAIEDGAHSTMEAARNSTPPTTASDGCLDAFDTTGSIDVIRAKTAELARRILPAPLDAIARLLDAENAPTDWVSSAKLAIVLGRVAADASADEIDRAAWQLGSDVHAKVPSLNTRSKNVGGGRKARGYDIVRLRQVIEAIREGRSIPPGPEELP